MQPLIYFVASQSRCDFRLKCEATALAPLFPQRDLTSPPASTHSSPNPVQHYFLFFFFFSISSNLHPVATIPLLMKQPFSLGTCSPQPHRDCLPSVFPCPLLSLFLFFLSSSLYFFLYLYLCFSFFSFLYISLPGHGSGFMFRDCFPSEHPYSTLIAPI